MEKGGETEAERGKRTAHSLLWSLSLQFLFFWTAALQNLSHIRFPVFSPILPYYKKLMLHEIKVLEINVT